MNCTKHLKDTVLVSLLLYSVMSLGSAMYELRQTQALEAQMQAELTALQKENAAMSQRLQRGIGKDEVIQLARQRLGLVLPGEKIFYFTTDREA